MKSFIRTHNLLVDNLGECVRRDLMDEINWNDRLIGIKGARGVGKTTFLLQYAKERLQASDRACLYINTNNFYIQHIGIVRFAEEFYNSGGKTLLIDQVYKLPSWSEQLRECYDRFPGLRIVFTGSPVMRLKDENHELNGIVKSYNLRGFSFREYIQIMTGKKLPKFTLEQILENHQDIAKQIIQMVNPKDHFLSYLHHGYYPFFLAKGNYAENLLKNMNMMIEVDILHIKQIELKYLAKIKQMFYLLTTNGFSVPNISQLSQELGMSRATIVHYIKYLMEARLVNMVYARNEEFPKKPARILLHNTNLMYSFYPQNFDNQDLEETFFCNAVWKDHVVNKCGTTVCTFLLDGKYEFRISEHFSKLKSQSKTYYAVNQCEVGEGNQIPLWLFGFLD